MQLIKRFSDDQLTQILEQALIYQCACPAQVCRTLLNLRELFSYQVDCADNSAMDRQVHEAIGLSSSRAHEEMEDCLIEVLKLEGWDLDTLRMPEDLQKRQVAML